MPSICTDELYIKEFFRAALSCLGKRYIPMDYPRSQAASSLFVFYFRQGGYIELCQFLRILDPVILAVIQKTGIGTLLHLHRTGCKALS